MQPPGVIIHYAHPSTRGPRRFDQFIERVTPAASVCLWVLVYVAIALCVIAIATLPVVLIVA